MSIISDTIKSEVRLLKERIKSVKTSGGSKSLIAEGKEDAIRNFFQKHLPQKNRVIKGTIIDSNRTRSREIDAIILAPDHPNLPNTLTIADATKAAIEIKTGIGKSELHTGLKQIGSVKKLRKMLACKRIGDLTIDYDDKYETDKKIISGIICEGPINNIDKTIEYIHKYYFDNNIPASEWIDFIVSIEDGYFFFTTGSGHVTSTFFGEDREENVRYVISVVKLGDNALEALLSFIISNYNRDQPFQNIDYIEHYMEDFLNFVKDCDNHIDYVFYNIDDLPEDMKIGPELTDLDSNTFNNFPDAYYKFDRSFSEESAKGIIFHNIIGDEGKHIKSTNGEEFSEIVATLFKIISVDEKNNLVTLSYKNKIFTAKIDLQMPQ